MQKITIKDIARLSGVGVSTVSRVVNNRPDVNEETRRRVMNIVRESSYIPNANAKHLKQHSSDTISVIIRGTTNEFFSGIAPLMQQYIEQAGHHFLAAYIDEKDDEFAHAVRVCTEKKVQGIIFLGGSPAGKEKELGSLGVPCVFSTTGACGIDQRGVYSVSVDDRKAAARAIGYLFDNGHRSIAVVGGKREAENSIGLRFQGVLDSFRNQGLEFDERLYFDSEFSLSSAYRAMSEGLLKGIPFTAVFAMSDVMAMGACKAITDSKRQVPGDISVIGFDGIEMARYYNPTIATVSQPAKEIAYHSVSQILGALEKKDVSAHITLPVTLVEGDSVRKISS